MIAAEHFSLKQEAVRQIVAIRERELTYMETRMNAMATQAALIGGFVITGFTAVDTSSMDVNLVIQYTFYVTTSISLACSVHVILAATFGSLWGPGLALLGPTGSVSKAYYALKQEQGHIRQAFVMMIATFLFQCVCLFWILDGDKDVTTLALLGTSIMAAGSLWTFEILYRMWSRFFKVDLAVDEHGNPIRNDLNAPSLQNQSENIAGEHGGDPGAPLLRDLGSHPDWDPDAKNTAKNRLAKTIEENAPWEHGTMQGTLLKRQMGATGMLGEVWRERYVVLHHRETVFVYYKSKADYNANKPQRRSVNLSGYEVLLDPNDFRWGLMLKPILAQDTRRQWHFRCATEAEREKWVHAFLAATLIAHGDKAYARTPSGTRRQNRRGGREREDSFEEYDELEGSIQDKEAKWRG